MSEFEELFLAKIGVPQQMIDDIKSFDWEKESPGKEVTEKIFKEIEEDLFTTENGF